MAGKKGIRFHCTVVDELVQVRLKSLRIGGFSGTSVPFVQCNQEDCQYVDQNIPPCPLHPDMFAQVME